MMEKKAIMNKLTKEKGIVFITIPFFVISIYYFKSYKMGNFIVVLNYYKRNKLLLQLC